MSDPELDAVVGQIWARLSPSIRADAARLLELTVEIGDPAGIEPGRDDAPWLEIRHLAHRLAGSLGSLGQHAAGREAVALEDLTAGLDRPDPTSWPRVRAHAHALITHLA